MKVKVPAALKVKSLGVPRYVWLIGIIFLAGTLAYVRYRNAQEEVTTDGDVDPNSVSDPELVGTFGEPLVNTPVQGVSTGSVSFLPGGGGVIQGGQANPAPPLLPPQTNIVINADTNNTGQQIKKCKDGRPKKKAPKGFHWACVNGHWVAMANKSNPNKNKDKAKCGKHPKKSAGKGYHWECSNSKWIRAKNKSMTRGLFEEGPLLSMSGPPVRNDVHRADRMSHARHRELNR